MSGTLERHTTGDKKSVMNFSHKQREKERGGDRRNKKSESYRLSDKQKKTEMEIFKKKQMHTYPESEEGSENEGEK